MSDLNLTVSGRVARLQLNRPGVLNALSPGLLQDIVDNASKLSERDDVNVVVLEGAGRSFSAGADLPEFGEHLEAKSQPHADLGRLAASSIAKLPQITVAAIHGYCVGGAIVLAAACDLRFASDASRYSIPEVDAGIPLAWGGMGDLVRLIGETRAVELVLSCRVFDAAEAERAGFLSRVMADDQFGEEIATAVDTLAARPPALLRRVKQQLTALRNGRFDPHNDAEALIAAFHDPESRAEGQRYIESRIKKKG